MKIGTAIRNTRVEKGLSQGELAEHIEISQTSLSHIENDIKQPSKSTLKKLSKALNVPEVYLYLMSIEKEDVSEEKKNVFDIMYPHIQKLIKDMII